MNYANVLTECDEPLVGNAVLNALSQLFEQDSKLLVLNVSEQAIAAKLAQHLHSHFPDHDVDVEYNRKQ
jgi:hypothetical protein